MRPAAPPRAEHAAEDLSTVVFVRHAGARGTVYTIMDEAKRFVGDSAAKTSFSVALPPGDHVFIAWDNATSGDFAFSFGAMGTTPDAPDLPRIEPLQATLAPGKRYRVEVKSDGSLRVLAPSLADEVLADTSPYTPDTDCGQAVLARTPMRVERIRTEASRLLEGYRDGELPLHTLRAKDGR
jgi:hypothetical protein